MAADLNRVTLVGRLTRDPEQRSLPSGDSLASMRLAVSSRSRTDDGSWGDKSNYFDVTVFGRQAETVTTYLAKGRRIGVDGRLSWREWQAQDGSKRQGVEIIANDVFFLDSRRDGDGAAEGWGDTSAAGGAGNGSNVRELATARAPGGEATDTDDDVPF